MYLMEKCTNSHCALLEVIKVEVAYLIRDLIAVYCVVMGM